MGGGKDMIWGSIAGVEFPVATQVDRAAYFLPETPRFWFRFVPGHRWTDRRIYSIQPHA